MAIMFSNFKLDKLDDGTLFWIGEVSPIIAIPDVPMQTYKIMALYQREYPKSINSIFLSVKKMVINPVKV